LEWRRDEFGRETRLDFVFIILFISEITFNFVLWRLYRRHWFSLVWGCFHFDFAKFRLCLLFQLLNSQSLTFTLASIPTITRIRLDTYNGLGFGNYLAEDSLSKLISFPSSRLHRLALRWLHR